MTILLTFILSYLLGSLNPARIITKLKAGIDITKVNSKNPGTSNVALTLGMKYAVIVGFLDIFKGALPVLVVRFIFKLDDMYWFIAGCSAILGHMHPIYNRFKGGKGTATFGGMVLAITPLISLLMAVIFTITLFKSKYMAIATLVVIVAYPIIYYFMGYHYISLILLLLFSVVSFYKHTPNFIRIYKKTEMKLDAVKTNEKEA